MSRAGWIRILLILVAILLLEAFCRFDFIDRFSVIPPSQMLIALGEIMTRQDILQEIIHSLLNILIAVCLAIVVGVGIGIALHPMIRIRRILDPLLSSYYALPLFAFYPLFIVIFGVGAIPIIIMGFLAGLAAMVLCTLDGLDSIPRVLTKVAKMHRLNPVTAALRLTIPAAAHQILAGIKLAVAYGFIGVISSEFILSGQGLGFEIGFAYNGFDIRMMYGLILFIVIFVILLNFLFHVLDEHIRIRSRP